jgi:hypothetical protein
LSTPQMVFLGLLFGLVIVSLAVLLNYFSLRYAVTNQARTSSRYSRRYKPIRPARPSRICAKASTPWPPGSAKCKPNCCVWTRSASA